MIAHETIQIVRRVIVLAALVSAVGSVVVISVKKAEDPLSMIFKWIWTALILAFMLRFVVPIVARGGYDGAFMGIPLTAACGVAFAAVWRRSLASLVATPFSSLYDGGNVPPEPRPTYSIAQAKQKKGQYLEAIADIRQQLERFPTDFEGHLLLAQIQAENLKDLPAAELTLQRLCAQSGHSPKNITFALFSLADWQLKFGQDAEAARRALEQIITLLPGTEFALSAAQRIAHLANAEMMLGPHDRKKFSITEGVRNLGLAANPEPMQPAEKEPAQLAMEYVKRLEEHPLDTEAREQLAILYADYYQRLDLASDQLEQMIQQPNQPAKLVVRWLNPAGRFTNPLWRRLRYGQTDPAAHH